jgi:hypothetical protein
MTRFAWMVLALSVLGIGCGIGDAQQRLRTAVDEKRGELSACYAGALQRDRNAGGEMRVWLEVDNEGGDVDNVEVSSTPIDDPGFGMCVDGVLRSVQLAEAPKANLRVEYSLMFTPEN